MVFREVTVVQIKETLRPWLKGDGERSHRPLASASTERRRGATQPLASSSESTGDVARASSPTS
jgi:hypothetical protein